MKPLNRRTFLKGAGVAVSLPLLNAMQPAYAADSSNQLPKRRMVTIDLHLGLHPKNFIPKTAGPEYELTPYLRVMEEFRQDMTIITGTSHPAGGGGHLGYMSLLTAAPRPAQPNFKNSISIDQLAAEAIGPVTRFSSLTLNTFGSIASSFSRNGVQVPPESRPSKVFGNLFLDGNSAEKKQQRQRLKDGQSIMDSVLGEARALQGRVDAEDRHKLDQYFTAVRATEQRLLKAEAWDVKPKPIVNFKPPTDINNIADVIGRASLMYEMMFYALQTDSTRLITFVNGGGLMVPTIAGVTQDYHSLSHHGMDPNKIAELTLIETAQMQAFAEFLKKLRSASEEGSSLLDQTMVLFSSNIGNASNHDYRNLPVILAGGGFQHGQHLAFDPKNNLPLSNVFVSMLQHLGLEIDKFGSSTGTITGLKT